MALNHSPESAYEGCSPARDVRDLFGIGEFLDDLDAVERHPRRADLLTELARRTISAMLGGDSQTVNEVHRICGRSGALGDLLEDVLDAQESAATRTLCDACALPDCTTSFARA